MRTAWAVVPEGEDRRTVAWDLLRGMLPPEVVLDNPCPQCGGPHGPVRASGTTELVGVAYARSRTTGAVVAVVGVAPAVLPGGRATAFAIDAEFADDPARDAAGLPLGLPVADWVRVEAVLKADGRGVRLDPAQVVVGGEPDAWTATVPGTADAYRGQDLAVLGLVVSAAWR